jgi:phenylalanyl-tRNA synthetase beta chain
MRVSLGWLREFVAIDRGPREVADALIDLGLEVSAVEEMGAGLERVLVGELLSVAPHPNADRLTLCVVSTGGDARHRIVCGARNMKPGDRVALALPGAVLPGGMAIRRSKIRGESSEGMMCSEVGLAWPRSQASENKTRPRAQSWHPHPPARRTRGPAPGLGAGA